MLIEKDMKTTKYEKQMKMEIKGYGLAKTYKSLGVIL